MKSILIWSLSLPAALLVWWVSTGDRREAVVPQAPAILQSAAGPARVDRANEFDGSPGDLSTIRTDLVATPSRLQLRALLGSQPTAVLTLESPQSVAFLQARPTAGAIEQGPTITRIDDRNFRIQVDRKSVV